MTVNRDFLLIPLSAGEFIDRYLIYELKIKRGNLNNPTLNSWLEQMWETYQGLLSENPSIPPLLDKLRTLHAELWCLENDVREKIGEGEKIDTVARMIFSRNDERHSLKDSINLICSGISPDRRYYG